MSSLHDVVKKFLSFDSADLRSRRSSQRFKITAGTVLALCGVFVVTLIVITASQQISSENVPQELVVSNTPPATQLQAQVVTVHVVGDVNKPGIYQLEEESRLVDALMAAGGVTDGAEACGLNLARVVKDGEQLVVLSSANGCSDIPSNTQKSQVSLNTTDAVGLDTLPGIGPTLSARIISWREQYGPFTQIDGLLEVPGIGQKLFDSIKDLVTL